MDKAKTVFDALASAGFKVAIDDFGIGQASLQHLAELNVTGIKIDRTFVARMASSRRYRIMVETILALGQALDLSVVAEGIETLEQLRALQDLGCKRGQGYLLSRPLLPEAVEAVFGPALLGRWDPTLVPQLSAASRSGRSVRNGSPCD
ncbi:MAG: EAL domain-containing protein [Acidimicrobiales bacterium]